MGLGRVTKFSKPLPNSKALPQVRIRRTGEDHVLPPVGGKVGLPIRRLILPLACRLSFLSLPVHRFNTLLTRILKSLA
jgi:hypothetical protein